jgi:hypothetical protein
MKNLLKILLLIAVITVLQSCGYNPPVLNDSKHPFIVESVDKINDMHSRYKSSPYQHGYNGEIILPTGMYNINDTIIIKK